jgi:hypothetical protein
LLPQLVARPAAQEEHAGKQPCAREQRQNQLDEPALPPTLR